MLDHSDILLNLILMNYWYDELEKKNMNQYKCKIVSKLDNIQIQFLNCKNEAFSFYHIDKKIWKHSSNTFFHQTQIIPDY